MEDHSADKGIVVAVEFGTTYSGVAWASTSHPDKHYFINQRPQYSSSSYDGMTSDKFPTEVAYEYSETGPHCLWGFQIYGDMPPTAVVSLNHIAHQLQTSSQTIMPVFA
ncbi:hypothetical protein BBP40_005207 [Aspergillus hancockii]|nr:hypothetical protein BBP40_005207 [Aspergillus hancockii]